MSGSVPGPLQGLKVVELGQLIAGPFAAKTLADFGADVVKIEPPPKNGQGGGDPLRLIRRGTEYSIMLGANELMNSRLSGSEEAMSRLAQACIAGVDSPRVLIGGLGMGFTLRAGLEGARGDGHVLELPIPAVMGQ